MSLFAMGLGHCNDGNETCETGRNGVFHTLTPSGGRGWARRLPRRQPRSGCHSGLVLGSTWPQHSSQARTTSTTCPALTTRPGGNGPDAGLPVRASTLVRSLTTIRPGPRPHSPSLARSPRRRPVGFSRGTAVLHALCFGLGYLISEKETIPLWDLAGSSTAKRLAFPQINNAEALSIGPEHHVPNSILIMDLQRY